VFHEVPFLTGATPCGCAGGLCINAILRLAVDRAGFRGWKARSKHQNCVKSAPKVLNLGKTTPVKAQKSPKLEVRVASPGLAIEAMECSMYFLGIGLLLVLMKILEIGPVGQWDWGKDWMLFAAPFGLAVAWWAWADWSGYSKKKAMEKMELRKQDRLAKNREAMGMAPVKKRKK
jgi:small Trp-rich protein